MGLSSDPMQGRPTLGRGSREALGLWSPFVPQLTEDGRPGGTFRTFLGCVSVGTRGVSTPGQAPALTTGRGAGGPSRLDTPVTRGWETAPPCSSEKRPPSFPTKRMT